MKLYSKDHKWVKKVKSDNSGDYKIGVTSYALNELGEVCFIQTISGVGYAISQGVSFGSIESVKACSEMIAPVSGIITLDRSNDIRDYSTISGDTDLIWVHLTDETELNDLMTEEEYNEYLESIKG